MTIVDVAKALQEDPSKRFKRKVWPDGLAISGTQRFGEVGTTWGTGAISLDSLAADDWEELTP